MSTPNDHEVMRRFMHAYAKADRANLSEVLSEDFVWHRVNQPRCAASVAAHRQDELADMIERRPASSTIVRSDDMNIIGLRAKVTHSS